MGRGVLAIILWLGLTTTTGGADSPRPQTRDFRPVDFSSLATPSEALARQVAALPGGEQLFHGVPFRIGSPLAVTGLESARGGEFFPTEVTGIKPGHNVKRIHLLHGTLFAEKDGVPVAKIVFHYASGGEETVRLGYGVHVRGWIAPRLEKRSALFDPNSQVAWEDVDERRGAATRIFQTALENPKPAEAIASIDIVSLFSRAAPFVLALTAEGTESTRPANRPLPGRKPVRDLHEFADSAYRRELTVRITDGPGGPPPTNSVVSLGLTDDKETYFFGETRADPQGVCRIPYPPQHALGLSVWVHAPDRAPLIISESKTNLAQFTGEYTAVLNPGLAVGGVVKDATGQAVADAQVVIHKITRLSPHHYGRVDYDAVRTAGNGKWTSRSLPEDLGGVSFAVTHSDFRPALYVTPGYAPPPTNSSAASSTTTRTSSSVTYQRLPDGTVVPNPPRRTAPAAPTTPLLTTNALLSAEAELILQPAALLQGTVADASGKPLPSAEVIVQRGTGERKYLRTDPKGHFQTRLDQPGDTAVIVLRAGSEPVFRNVNLAPGLASPEIRLSPARVLHGRVQDPNSVPIGGARVRLDEWNGTSDLLKFQAITDERGGFAWTGAPPDQVTFFVSKTNFNNTRHSFGGSADNIVIPISRSPGVFGKVYDAETKKPVASFTVIPGRKYSSGENEMIHWDRSESGRGSRGEYSLRINSYYFQPEARVLVEAPGYEPQVSRALSGIDSHSCDFALKKGKGIDGLVLLPDGSPAAGAALLMLERGENGYVTLGGQLRGNGGSSDLVRSDARGRFEFTPKLDPARIVVSHEQGFSEVNVAAVAKSKKITLRKWGRVKGVMRVGEKGATEAAVQLQGNLNPSVDPDGRYTSLSFSQKVEPDGEGAFDFDKVPPGEHHLAVEYRFKDDRDGNPPLSHGFPVLVKPGETTDATLGGTGRRVTGRVKLLGGDLSDVDWRRDVHRLVLMLPGDALPPANARGAAAQGPRVFLGGLNVQSGQPMTPEAMLARQRAERNYVLLFDTNGVFRADHVPPGKYNLSLNVTDPEDEYYNRRIIGTLNKEVAVPNEPKTGVNAPFDLGVLDLTIHPRLKPGELVPSFEAKTIDGKPLKLADYRGKPLLLHFWGLSLGYSSYDLQVLKEFQQSHGAAGKFAILGCNLDADPRNAEQFAKSQGMSWPQAYLGQWDQTPVAGMFGLNGNTAGVLIDAEGKLASGHLRGTALRNALANALGGSEAATNNQ